MFNYNTTITPAAETTDKIRMSFLQWLATEETTKQAKYATYREYYDGVHDTMLSDRMREFLQVKDAQEFNTNYCPIVVDAVAERLVVVGFDAGDQAETFWDWWNYNRMDGKQKVVHTSGGRDGDAYVIVSWDDENDKPVFTPELAFDGSEGVKVYYSKDHAGEIDYATKRWRIERGGDAGYIRRLNVYYPNRVEKFISDGRRDDGQWREYIEDDYDDNGTELTNVKWWTDDRTKPTNVKWWTDDGTENGEPLGVPVFHFKANDRGYNFGKSDLHDIIPVQNALNKSMIDLLAAADTTAFRIFVLLGEKPTDATLSPGVIFYSTKPPGGEEGVSFQAIPGEDLTPMINLKDSMVSEIARISRVPLSYFQVTGQVAAEGTLKQQESGLVAKVIDRQVTFGNSWEDVMRMARRLNNAFGSGAEMSEDEPISTQWQDPETRNELEHLEAIAIKVEKLGIPLITAWREARYEPDEIEQMLEDAQQQDSFGFIGPNDEVTQ